MVWRFWVLWIPAVMRISIPIALTLSMNSMGAPVSLNRYASSLDLYIGVDEFRRVGRPQPGDLAVWQGHAGIVIDPTQHSFFTVLSSGPGVDSYDSPYWKQRGRPRFFRYVRPRESLVRRPR